MIWLIELEQTADVKLCNQKWHVNYGEESLDTRLKNFYQCWQDAQGFALIDVCLRYSICQQAFQTSTSIDGKWPLTSSLKINMDQLLTKHYILNLKFEQPLLFEICSTNKVII